MTIEGQFAPFQRLEFEDIDRRFPGGGGAPPPPGGNDAWLWQGTDHILWDHTDKMMISMGPPPVISFAVALGTYLTAEGFPPSIAAPGVYAALGPTQINRAVGTLIGNMTDNGGLAAAFDGVNDQSGSVASVALSGQGFTAYVGKTFSSPVAIHHAVTYGANNFGYSNGVGNITTLNLYAKAGAAPTAFNDGTLLGAITFPNMFDEHVGRTIMSTDTTTLWNHVWINRYEGSIGVVAEIEFWTP